MPFNQWRSLLALVFFLGISSVFAADLGSGLFNTTDRYADSTRKVWIPERARLHDSIVEKYLAGGVTSKNPIIIFTAGPMGAGKSTFIKVLHDLGIFNIDDFVWSDPDQFKDYIPEYALFSKIDIKQAATLVQEESGRIAEKVFFRALQENKNIIVDGTLRHTEYFRNLISKIRREKPQYGMVILFVDAEEKTLLARVQDRFEDNGRFSPSEVVLDTKRFAGESVGILQKLTDSTVRVSTESGVQIRSFLNRGAERSVDAPLDIPQEPPLAIEFDWPDESLAGEVGLTLSEEIRGAKQVLEVASGTYFEPSALENFLGEIKASHHWLLLRESDPQIEKILEIAKKKKFETLLIGRDPLNSKVAAQATLFLASQDDERNAKLWDSLVAPGLWPSFHLRLDFNIPLSIEALVAQVKSERARFEEKLEKDLAARNIKFVRSLTLDSAFTGHTPLMISGAARQAWQRLSLEQRGELESEFAELFALLDPQHTLILTDGGSGGLDEVLHRLARVHGLKSLAAGAVDIAAADYGQADFVALFANSWFGRARAAMKYLRRKKGSALFVAGGGALKKEVKIARDYRVAYHLSGRFGGSAASLAAAEPERSFSSVDEMVAALYRDNPRYFKPELRRAARDRLFAQVSAQIARDAKSEILGSFADFKAKARAYKTVVVGGYAGLGYTDPLALKAEIEALVASRGDNTLYVFSGSVNGIGEAIEWIPEIATAAGFKNVKVASIASRNAAKYKIPRQDFIYFVDTEVDDWSLDEEGLALRVELVENTGGEFVYFRGGRSSTAEIAEALKRGLDVTLVTGNHLQPTTLHALRSLVAHPGQLVDGTSRFIQRSDELVSLATRQSLRCEDLATRP